MTPSTVDYLEQYTELSEKQELNQKMRNEIAHQYDLLMQAFWQKFGVLQIVELEIFTPQELKAWISKSTEEKLSS